MANRESGFLSTQDFISTTSQYSLQKKTSTTSLTHIFIALVYITITQNFDTGVFPPVLQQISEDLKISEQQLAFLGIEFKLGNLPYLGVCITTVLIPLIKKQYAIKCLLTFSLFVNMMFCVQVTFSNQYLFLCLGRFMQGVSQSFYITYTPIWIVNFAPAQYQTTWMGINQAFSPLGIVFGYMITGMLAQNVNSNAIWRVGIFLQAVFLVPVTFFIIGIEEKDIDIEKIPNRVQDNYQFQTESIAYLKEVTNIILKNKLFIYSCLALVMQFFTVSVFLFWGTSFFEIVLGLEKNLAMVSIGLVCITSPIIGVLIGGYVSDRSGGASNAKYCILLGFKSTFVGYIFINMMTYMTSPLGCVVFLWIGVICCSSVLPILTTIMIDCLEKEVQPIGQCYSILLNNFLGYFASPMISSLFMYIYDDQKTAMTVGVRYTIILGNLSWIFLYLAYEHLQNQPSNASNLLIVQKKTQSK